MKTLPHLDLARAFAAFWVLSAHCVIWVGAARQVHLPDPKIAVDLFMILSGYLMAHTATERWGREPLTRWANWRRFYLRRFMRLAPLYYLTLAFVVLAAPAFLGGYAALQTLDPVWWGPAKYNPALAHFDPLNIVLHLTFLFGLLPYYSFSTFLPDWSLGLEMQFYAAFPALFLVMRRFGPIRAALLLALASIVLDRLLGHAIAHGWIAAWREPSLLIMRLPIFLAGMLIFAATEQRRVEPALVAVGLCALRAGAYGTGVFWLLVPAAAIAAQSLWPSPLLARRLAARPVRFAADVSYSVYLIHGPILAILGSRIALACRAAGWSLPATVVPVWIAVATLSVGIGALLHRFLERPGIRLGARLAAAGARA